MSSQEQPHPVTPGGGIAWPEAIDRRYHRRVVIRRWHRRADGSHYNMVANRACSYCVLESELCYLMTMWAVEHDLPFGRHRKRKKGLLR